MSAAVGALIRNETRALLPTWIAALAAASLVAIARGDARIFSLLALLTTTIALGAQTVGHEYAHRTVNLTLALPVSRQRVYTVKLAVLAALLLGLAGYGWLVGLPEVFGRGRVPASGPWFALAATLGLAPWLTMLCRSALAGTVFTASLPPTLFIVLILILNRTAALPEHVVLTLFSRLLGLFIGVAAILGWNRFMQLEAIDGSAAGIQLRWQVRPSVREAAPGHPLWQLLKKELRLQQMTFAITIVYLAGCGAAVMFRLPKVNDMTPVVGALTVMYVLGLPVLVGADAIAQERQLGTLAWQLQLPIPLWQQWAAKMVTVFGVALTLSVGARIVFLDTLWPSERAPLQIPIILGIVMTALGVYISSLCSTAVRAVVTSVTAVSVFLWLALSWVIARPAFFNQRVSVPLLWLLALTLLLVGFAFVNHRAEPPARARILRQTLSLAALIASGLLILG